MGLKLIVALVEDERTDSVIEVAQPGRPSSPVVAAKV